MQVENTPFWLEIKTEYIDANLDKVIQYLSKESYNKDADSFFEETVRLLTERVGEIIGSRATAGLSADDSGFDQDAAVTALKILGAWILIQEDRSSQQFHEAFFFFVSTLITLLPQTFCEDLAEMAVISVTRASIEYPGFSWTDMKDLNLVVMAHKMISSAKFSDAHAPSAWFQGKGSLHLANGMVELYECNRDEAKVAKMASSLMLMEQSIQVQSPASDRIIQSEEDDLEAMHKFTVGYIRTMDRTIPSPERRVKRYAPGENVTVRFMGKDAAGNLLVETADEDHERIKGIIPVQSKAYMNFYSAKDVGRYLKEGDFFGAEYKGGEREEFDMEKSFVSQMIENTVSVGEDILAVLRTINKKGLMCWWTQDGYPAYVSAKNDPGTFEPGDTAYLKIDDVETNGYVYASILEAADDDVDEEDSKKYCVEGFVYDGYVPAKAPDTRSVSASFAGGLCRLLVRYQRVLDQASDRFRVLCVCRILARMTDDASAGDYLSVACDYLRNLVFFAKGQIDKIRPLNIPSPLTADAALARRQEIVSILREYGSAEDSAFLSGIIHREDQDALLVRLAKLVQSGNRIQEVYPAINPVIKREIARFLAVETEDHTDLEEVSGPDLGVENSRTEFKTSFFFAPKDAAEQLQEKNIFRVLCSFLNTGEGGILYLGVNDSGGITGLESDLAHLKRNVSGSYKDDTDSYVRYITDRAKVYFDLDVRIHFHVEPAYGGRVVTIRVDPYEHGVVEFEGVPYIRNNSESVKMSQKLRRQIAASRVTARNGLPAKVLVALEEAVKEKDKVRLLRYSSNSGNCRDRYVEPYCFIGGNRFVWCYDLEDGTNKLFRLSRIGNVQVTGEPWTEEARHRKGDTDIFYLTGDSPVRVRLELDTMARNLLLEEYPESAGDLSEIEDGKWLLDTKVLQMYGVGRFYAGLAEHIRIVDSPELEEYTKEYLSRLTSRF